MLIANLLSGLNQKTISGKAFALAYVLYSHIHRSHIASEVSKPRGRLFEINEVVSFQLLILQTHRGYSRFFLLNMTYFIE